MALVRRTPKADPQVKWSRTSTCVFLVSCLVLSCPALSCPCPCPCPSSSPSPSPSPCLSPCRCPCRAVPSRLVLFVSLARCARVLVACSRSCLRVCLCACVIPSPPAPAPHVNAPPPPMRRCDLLFEMSSFLYGALDCLGMVLRPVTGEAFCGAHVGNDHDTL